MSDADDIEAPVPPGWYDDASGRTRWWTGLDWSDHFEDGLGPSGTLPLSTRCPTCGSLDRVQVVGLLLQEGTSHSLNSSTTETSALAQRLSPPPRPRPPVWRWTLWFALTGVAVALIYGGSASGSVMGAVLTGIFLLVPLALVAWALAVSTALIARPHYRGLQADWDHRAASYFRHLYCLRDDTMFVAGSPAQRPEEVKARTFWR